MPRRRTLSDEEREIWQRVARTARRLRPAPDPLPQPGPAARPDAGATAPALPAPLATVPPQLDAQPGATFRLRPPPAPRLTLDLAETPGTALARAPVAMDHKTHQRMMRGKLDPDARIDLHGMTLAEAHPALTGFILHAHARGLRLVLVITGKGRRTPDDDAAPMPRRAGALRHAVPQWLRAAPLGPVVLDLREAHRSHGGGGALYVYLRRRR